MDEVQEILSAATSKPRGRTPLYNFGAMVRGDAFITDARLVTVSAASNMYAKRHPGFKFKCETMPDTRIRVTCVGAPT